MAKRLKLKRGAIIFFEGEKNNHMIYLLRKGSVAATSFSPAKGEDETRALKEGDFFGLKATLTDRNHDETIQVLENGEAIVFTQSEFNEMLKKNIKLLLRLLISFSNNMLTIHKLIEAKMSFGKSLISNREKILENANHYYNGSSFTLALYTYTTYAKLFPNSNEITEVQKKIATIKNNLQTENRKDVALAKDGEPFD